MSISISGSTALSGLSGMDTNFDTTLEQLYSVEKTQLNQLEAWRSDWQLRYDAFNDVIDQMTAAKEMLATIGSVNNFVTKNATSTDEKVLTAVASGTATDSHHKVVVSQMASNAIWCNTAVFESKTDIINTSGQTQQFVFEYAGKEYSYNVAPNTTLDSFVSLINNASNNPGIKISVINTGHGYVYQIAGKSTGESNSLAVHSCALKGLDASGTESLWQSNSSFSLTDPVTTPTNYIYTATYGNGQTVSVALKGDATLQEVGEKLQNSVGTGLISVQDDGNGKITLNGVSKLTRREANEEEVKPGSYKVGLGGNPQDQLQPGSTDPLVVTVTLDENDTSGNPLTRTFTIGSDATRQQLVDQVNQALGTSARVGLNNDGSYDVSFPGVKDISFATEADPTTPISILAAGTYTEPATSSYALSTTNLEASKVTLTFAQDKLNTKLDESLADDATGAALRYTLVKTTGEAVYIDITSDKTNQDLLNEIANQLGVTAGTDANSNSTLELDGYTSFFLSTGATGTSGVSSKVDASLSVSSVYSTSNADGTTSYYLETPPNLTYSITTNMGVTYPPDSATPIPSGATMWDVYQDMKTYLGDDVFLVDSDGQVVTETDPSLITGPVYLQCKNVMSLTSPLLDGQIIASDNWSITKASNAIYEVDNWPMSMQSESNTITDLLDGVALTLQGVGEANLTISTDIASIETSIQNFLDAVNSVLLTIRDLTAVDENKQTTTNDPDNANSSNYSKSTLTAEKGGLLTGNYGVQLVKTRFLSVVTGTPPGFQSITSADDLLSGDILSCLSNMGVKTDTDTTSSTYGLLVRAPRSDFMQSIDEANYNDMINNHASELVDFFVSSGTGTSTSSAFRYNSHISGITEAGIYDVQYNVDANGNISDVTIGGEPCSRNESQGGYYYTCTSGSARGLAISIDDLSEGSHTGQVRIKQGLVQTVQYFLEKELKFNDVNVTANATPDVINAQLSLKSENGAMMTLRSNYANIMANIDKSIEKEQKRLSSWYTRQKNVFANLETLLREMNDQQTSLESQLKQLSSD